MAAPHSIVAAAPGDSGRDPLGRLHVLTDEVLQTRFSHLELAVRALNGGATVIQLREKRLRTTAHLVGIARELLSLCVVRGAQLVIDDRADVALACGSGNVHLGASDLEPTIARRILGPTGRIGATANDLEQARRALAGPIDYLGVGPVFATTSKDNPAPVLGLAGLRTIAGLSPVPVIAIGGITAERVADVLACGAYGVAVLGAVCAAGDPERACAELRAAIDAALAAMGHAAAIGGRP